MANRKIERVLKMKQVKDWGHYFVEHSCCTKDNKVGTTITKENFKISTMLIGKCVNCGANFFGKFNRPADMSDTGVESTVDCPNESCTVRMKFVDGILSENGIKPPKPVEPTPVEPVVEPVVEPFDSSKGEDVKAEEKPETV